MAGEAAGTKPQRDQLRATLRDQDCTPEQIATEMGRQFHFRPRQAWRHAHGWTQGEVAAAYNRELRDDQAPMTGKRISDFEAWPHGGKKPSIHTLAMLAKVYSTVVLNLVDLDDRQRMSTKDLIILDTYNTPQTAPSQSPDTPPENNTHNPGTPGEHTVGPESNISITVHQNHPPETVVPSRYRRGHLVAIFLMVIAMVIGGVIAGKTMMTHSRSTAPARASSPPVTEPASPGASIPLPVSPSSMMQPPPSSASTPVPAGPRGRFTPLPTPLPAVNASPAQQTPLSPQMMLASPSIPATQQQAPSRADPPPPETPTDDTDGPTTDVSWKNMYYDMCLDEQEPDTIHDPANLQLWECNGASNQTWTEKTIDANPTSIAKNLISGRTGRCITYQPGDYSDRAKVWLTPCGKDGQGWIRIRNGTGYMFEAAEIHGMCMAATNAPVTDRPDIGGYTGIQLRHCDTSSPLKDWRFY